MEQHCQTQRPNRSECLLLGWNRPELEEPGWNLVDSWDSLDKVRASRRFSQLEQTVCTLNGSSGCVDSLGSIWRILVCINVDTEYYVINIHILPWLQSGASEKNMYLAFKVQGVREVVAASASIACVCVGGGGIFQGRILSIVTSHLRLCQCHFCARCCLGPRTEAVGKQYKATVGVYLIINNHVLHTPATWYICYMNMWCLNFRRLKSSTYHSSITHATVFDLSGQTRCMHMGLPV